jgi:hypothetical protein
VMVLINDLEHLLVWFLWPQSVHLIVTLWLAVQLVRAVRKKAVYGRLWRGVDESCARVIIHFVVQFMHVSHRSVKRANI